MLFCFRLWFCTCHHHCKISVNIYCWSHSVRFPFCHSIQKLKHCQRSPCFVCCFIVFVKFMFPIHFCFNFLWSSVIVTFHSLHNNHCFCSICSHFVFSVLSEMFTNRLLDSNEYFPGGKSSFHSIMSLFSEEFLLFLFCHSWTPMFLIPVFVAIFAIKIHLELCFFFLLLQWNPLQQWQLHQVSGHITQL